MALRQGEWKAIFGTKWSGGHTNANYGGLGPDKTMDSPNSGQLYNLQEDLEEKTDLLERHPEVVEQLRQKQISAKTALEHLSRDLKDSRRHGAVAA